jgi:hypothetical protein
MKPTLRMIHPAVRRLLAWTIGTCVSMALMAPGWAATSPEALQAEAEHAFWWGDFATLDKLNESLKHGKHFTRDGGVELEFFHRGIGSVIGATVDRREPYLRELEAQALQWTTEHPQSTLAHNLYASILVQHAWSYRGGGYSKNVPPQAWKDFNDYLHRAVDYLNAHTDVALTDSYAHGVLLSIGMGLGWNDGQMAAIQRDGLKRNPNDIMLYFDMVTTLLPKWGGDPKALDNYIHWATEQTRADFGTGMYARLYSFAADEQFGHALFEDSLADWPAMKKSYEDMMARFPDAPARHNRFAYMACLAKDRPTLVKVLAELDGQIDAKQWGPNPERSLEGCQRWAKEDGVEPQSAAPASPRTAPSNI